ncbi:unnamed protein product, partial [Lymnaea stagnalis]
TNKHLSTEDVTSDTNKQLSTINATLDTNKHLSTEDFTSDTNKQSSTEDVTSDTNKQSFTLDVISDTNKHLSTEDLTSDTNEQSSTADITSDTNKQLSTVDGTLDTNKQSSTVDGTSDTNKQLSTLDVTSDTNKHLSTEDVTSDTNKQLSTMDATSDTNKQLSTEDVPSDTNKQSSTLDVTSDTNKQSLTVSNNCHTAREETSSVRLEVGEAVDHEIDSELRRRHLEILELAQEIIRSAISYRESTDDVDPELIREWDREDDITFDESIREAQDVGGEVSYRKEETIAETPSLLVRTNRHTAMMDEGPAVRGTGHSLTEILESGVEQSQSWESSPHPSIRCQHGGELSYKKEETVAIHKGILQPSQTVERGSLVFWSSDREKLSSLASTEVTDLDHGGMLPQEGSDEEHNDNIASQIRLDQGDKKTRSVDKDDEKTCLLDKGDEKTSSVDNRDEKTRLSQPAQDNSSQSKHSSLTKDEVLSRNSPDQTEKPGALEDSSNTIQFANADNKVLDLSAKVFTYPAMDALMDQNHNSNPQYNLNHSSRIGDGETSDVDASRVNARERSPLARQRNAGTEIPDVTISNYEILNEIEKLRSEHTKMMGLLERSREKKSKKKK